MYDVRQLVMCPRWIFPPDSCCSVIPHTAVTSSSFTTLAVKLQEKVAL